MYKETDFTFYDDLCTGITRKYNNINFHPRCVIGGDIIELLEIYKSNPNLEGLRELEGVGETKALIELYDRGRLVEIINENI